VCLPLCSCKFVAALERYNFYLYRPPAEILRVGEAISANLEPLSFTQRTGNETSLNHTF